jgi:hypothetical protein
MQMTFASQIVDVWYIDLKKDVSPVAHYAALDLSVNNPKFLLFCRDRTWCI